MTYKPLHNYTQTSGQSEENSFTFRFSHTFPFSSETSQTLENLNFLSQAVEETKNRNWIANRNKLNAEKFQSL